MSADHVVTPEEKMAAARAMVIFKAPFFADAVYGFVFHPIEGIPTMLVTPKLVLGYSPRWALEASVAALAADIYHEVHHFVRRHFLRGALVKDMRLVNIAGDLAINPDELDEGWDLDKSAILPEHFGLPRGKTMEEYLDLLQDLKQKQGGGPGPPEPTGGGQGKKSGGGKPQNKNEQQPSSGGAGDEEGQQPKPPGIASGSCGGIAGHTEYPEIEAALDATPDLGRSPTEIKNIEKRVVLAVRNHAESKGRGNMPAALLDLITAFDEPSYVRWEDELGHILRDATGRVQAGGEDFSLARPAKRALMWGMIRAGMIERLPEVAVIRDSSGSMGAEQLTACCREAYAVMQALGIDEVWFTDADTEVSTPWKRVGADFFRSLTEVYGRGGTSFVQPIQSARELTPQPDILIYCTDGDGTAPKEAPLDMAVVWCVVAGHYNRAPARWGHTVIISDDPATRRAPLQYNDDDDDVS